MPHMAAPPPQSMRNTETSGWERGGDGYLPLTKPRSLMFLKTDTADKDREAQPKASKGEKTPQGSPSTAHRPLMPRLCLTETCALKQCRSDSGCSASLPFVPQHRGSFPRLCPAQLHMPQQQLAALAGKVIWKT